MSEKNAKEVDPVDLKLERDDAVHINARVLATRMGPHVAIEHSTAALALDDGQRVETNIRNIAGLGHLTGSVPSKSAEIADLRKMLSESEAALLASREENFTLQSDLSATKELLKGAEKRLTEAENKNKALMAKAPAVATTEKKSGK